MSMRCWGVNFDSDSVSCCGVKSVEGVSFKLSLIFYKVVY